jgi:hypothetical protein
MNDNTEQVVLEIDEAPAVAAVGRANAALAGYGKNGVTAIDAADKAFQNHGALVVRTADRTRNSVERLVASQEKLAQTYGKTGVERLVAQRDQLIQRLNGESAAVERVRSAYEKMIQVEKSVQSGRGFSVNYAIRGVKDVAEGRGTFALAELVNELMVMRGAVLVTGLVATGIAAIGIAAYETRQKLKELAEEPRKIGLAFGEMILTTRTHNDELRLQNDHLADTIAKLEHKPRNLLAEALDEARVSADRLATSLNKDAIELAKIVKENGVGMFGRFMGHQGTDDIQRWVEEYQKTVRSINIAGESNVHRAKTPEAAKQAQDEWDRAIARTISTAQGKVGGWLAEAEAPHTVAGRDAQPGYGMVMSLSQRDDPQTRAERLATLRGVSTALALQGDLAQLQESNATLEGKKRAAENNAEAQERSDKLANQYREWFRKLDNWDIKNRKEQETILEGSGSANEREITKNTLDQRAQNERDAGLFFGRYYGPPAPASGFELQAQYSARTTHEERMAGINAPPGNERGLAVQQAAARLDVINTIRDRELSILDITRDAYQVAEVKNKADLEASQVRYGLEEKLAELRRKQFDEIKGKTENLLHTLFTNPKNFGSQLFGTLRDAGLKPIEDKLSTMIAGPLQRMFGGGRGIDNVQLINGAVPVVVMGAGSSPAAGGGFSSAAGTFSRLLGLGGGLAGLAGASDTPAGMVTSTINYGGGGSETFSGIQGGLSSLGPGGTPGFAGPVGSLGGGASSGGGLLSGLSGILGNGGRGGAAIGGALGLIAGLQHKNAAGTILGGASLGYGLSKQLGMTGYGGAIAGAGFGLALNGIQRGGALGIAEATGGGAVVGMQFGGPLGAAIGAGVGFLASLGRTLFGGDDDATHASKLIKQRYGVDIPKGSDTIRQILAMAKQNFGGAISVAIYSPQVREIVQLYADSTGQKSGLWADTVHSASLTETGGNLYQSATYRNGTPYTYASPLPTLGPSGGTIPTANPMHGAAPTYLSVHLDGQSAAQFMTGQYVTPGLVGQQSLAAAQRSSFRIGQAGAMFAPGAVTS